ncbi:MAG: NAD(P)-dependent alcohol dehydrogenase [Fuerstiella sp.]|nr:NAD(P)-dependent alcohol dehydrogenase [Fuerstiella sp.]
MKAVRLHQFDKDLKRSNLVEIDDVPEPTVRKQDDVIVRIGGAGLCRTDLHIIKGNWNSKVGRPLPYILGHENAGWVHDVGDGVKHVKPGDPVIVHPLITDGTCPECRRGEDMYCPNGRFPGITHDGGFAEFFPTKQRAVIKLPPELEPKDVAPYADGGLTAYRAARKAAETMKPGMSVVILGFGGLGHIAAQVLRNLCAAQIIIVDTSEQALDLARECGFTNCLPGGNAAAETVRQLCTSGVDAVMDFAGEKETPEQCMSMLRKGGTYYVVGYGGIVSVPSIDLIFDELNVVGTLVGNYTELCELMILAAREEVKLTTTTYRLDQVNEAIHDLIAGQLTGRAVLVP